MTYFNAEKYIKFAPTAATNGSDALRRTERICTALGNPQVTLRYVTFAGNNEKNLCAAMLCPILVVSGYTVGMLVASDNADLRGKIRIDGTPVSRESFAAAVEAVAGAVAQIKAAMSYADDKHMSFIPTQNELLCAVAFRLFADNNVDIALMCADNGRYDPVNVTPTSALAVITSSVGASFEASLGVIRRGTREVVCSSAFGDSFNSLRNACAKYNSRLTVPLHSELAVKSADFGGASFTYRQRQYEIKSAAPYITDAALTVIEAAYALRRIGLKIKSANIDSALSTVRVPLCFEFLSVYPTLIVNGHDAGATPTSLLSDLSEAFLRFNCIEKQLHFVIIQEPQDGFDNNLEPLIQKGFSVTGITYLPPLAIPREQIRLSKTIKTELLPCSTVVCLGERSEVGQFTYFLREIICG